MNPFVGPRLTARHQPTVPRPTNNAETNGQHLDQRTTPRLTDSTEANGLTQQSFLARSARTTPDVLIAIQANSITTEAKFQ